MLCLWYQSSYRQTSFCGRPLGLGLEHLNEKKLFVWECNCLHLFYHRLHSKPAMSNRGQRAACSPGDVLCGPVSFSLLCMYKTMTACLYFDHLKFDIFDAMVFTAWWEEAGNSIDFSPCNRKVWSPIKILTGRSASSSRLCPVSAYSIASQLM